MQVRILVVGISPMIIEFGTLLLQIPLRAGGAISFLVERASIGLCIRSKLSQFMFPLSINKYSPRLAPPTSIFRSPSKSFPFSKKSASPTNRLIIRPTMSQIFKRLISYVGKVKIEQLMESLHLLIRTR